MTMDNSESQTKKQTRSTGYVVLVILLFATIVTVSWITYSNASKEKFKSYWNSISNDNLYSLLPNDAIIKLGFDDGKKFLNEIAVKNPELDFDGKQRAAALNREGFRYQEDYSDAIVLVDVLEADRNPQGHYWHGPRGTIISKFKIEYEGVRVWGVKLGNKNESKTDTETLFEFLIPWKSGELVKSGRIVIE